MHLIYDLNEKRLKNLLEWLFLQRKFNLGKIRLYLSQIRNNVADIVSNIRQEKFDESFVEIIQYKNELKDFCKTTTLMSDNVVSEEMCNISYKKHFSKVKQIHENINTNDCYLNHKYVYEYVSNYDFDEIILPRRNLALNQSEFLSYNSSIPKYDMYSYTKYLHNLLGGQNVSFIHFENTFMLIGYRTLLEKILNFSNDEISKKSLCYEKDNRSVLLKLEENDSEMIEKFWKRIIPFIDGLNETNRLKSNKNGTNDFFYNTKWNNAYSYKTSWRIRAGKSIYVTDNTLTINQHVADNVLKGKFFKIVPFNLGFLSHFRNDFNIKWILLEGEGKEIGFSGLNYDYSEYSEVFRISGIIGAYFLKNNKNE